jgi:hypothetical protein
VLCAIATRILCTHVGDCILTILALCVVLAIAAVLRATVFSLHNDHWNTPYPSDCDDDDNSACGSRSNSILTAVTSANTAANSAKSSGDDSVGLTDNNTSSSDPNSINYRYV